MGRMTPRRRSRSRAGLRAAVLLGFGIVPLMAATGLADLPAPLSITVNGRPVLVRHGATFGEVIVEYRLHAISGRLLDVRGKVLEHGADPGRILLNAEPASLAAGLADGDAVLVVNGADRTEGTRRIVTTLKKRRPSNPQFTLATSKVQKIVTEGRISGTVVSVRYRAVGRTKRPPAVALTFDDGPWPGSTRKILGVLQGMHARATFFIVGYLAERYPGLVRSVIETGMALGDHSWDHPIATPFDALSPERIRTEIAKTSRLLQDRFGVRTTLFRPPGGSYDRNVTATASALGMRIVEWNVDPRDWSSSATPRSIVRNVLANVRPGSIVDLHDGGGDQSATIAALPRIIRGIRKMGLRLVVIGP